MKAVIYHRAMPIQTTIIIETVSLGMSRHAVVAHVSTLSDPGAVYAIRGHRRSAGVFETRAAAETYAHALVEQAIALADEPDELVRLTGAAATLFIVNTNRE